MITFRHHTILGASAPRTDQSNETGCRCSCTCALRDKKHVRLRRNYLGGFFVFRREFGYGHKTYEFPGNP